jgi:predicted ribosomally synthesized peptide with nif11-like leader
MSLENAKRFIEDASRDQALQEKLAGAHEPAEVLRLVVEAGSERQLPFTSEEFLASVGTMTQQNAQAGELSDSDLNQVSGGNPLLLVVGAVIGVGGSYIGEKYAKEIKGAVNTATSPSVLVKDYLK